MSKKIKHQSARIVDGRLHGKVAVITGASSGIGESTARELARQGASVVLTARRIEPLQKIAREIQGLVRRLFHSLPTRQSPKTLSRWSRLRWICDPGHSHQCCRARRHRDRDLCPRPPRVEGQACELHRNETAGRPYRDSTRHRLSVGRCDVQHGYCAFRRWWAVGLLRAKYRKPMQLALAGGACLTERLNGEDPILVPVGQITGAAGRRGFRRPGAAGRTRIGGQAATRRCLAARSNVSWPPARRNGNSFGS